MKPGTRSPTRDMGKAIGSVQKLVYSVSCWIWEKTWRREMSIVSLGT